MTIRKMLIHYLKSGQASIGQIVNTSNMIYSQLKARDDLGNDEREKTLKDIEQLIRIVAELQISIADFIILLTEENADLAGKIKLQSFHNMEQSLTKISQHLNDNLPKRDVPVMPRGSELAIQLFQLENSLFGAEMFWAEEKENFGEKAEDIKPITNFLTSGREFAKIAARWANLLLLQKEFLWVEPKNSG
jgi:hypothetical protein